VLRGGAAVPLHVVGVVAPYTMRGLPLHLCSSFGTKGTEVSKAVCEEGTQLQA